MPENRFYCPEGLRQPIADWSLSVLQTAQAAGTILEAPVQRCDAAHALHLSLGTLNAVIPREEAVSPRISGADRDIAILSRVGKPACFVVSAIDADAKGSPVIRLSRKAAQERALDAFLSDLRPGSVVTARVTHLTSFGAFLDIGCGVVGMLPIERISVSRIAHPSERFQVGQKILAVVSAIDRDTCRFTLSHRELLGTWMENASRFQPGETVAGIVRSVKDYGAFIELTPNLSGLADTRQPLQPGDRVSVYIKSIRPERMKVKLHIIERLPDNAPPPSLRYQITDGILSRWVYSPPNYERPPVETVFSEEPDDVL